MNKYIKGIGIFTGGVTVGLVAGMKIAEKVIKDKFDDLLNEYPTPCKFNTDEIIFDSAECAKFVLDQIFKIFDMNGYVAVGDMYDLAGLDIPNNSYDYGWTVGVGMNKCKVIECEHGYFIKMPVYHRIR